MTLVASFSAFDWPVVVGDVLISLPHKGRQTAPFNVPTYANVNERASLSPSGHLVAGLVQKVNVLSPRLILAWAGSNFCARFVLQEILEFPDPCFDDVAKVLDKWQTEAGVDLYITGLFLGDPIGTAIPIMRFAWDSVRGWNSTKHSFPGYGDCYVGGSGEDSFLNLLTSSSMSGLSSAANNLEAAICSALAQLGNLAGDQLRTGAGIDDLFGGAFEIGTVLNGRVQKIGDIAYHFWEAQRTVDGQVTITFHASLRIDYFEDYLLVRKLEFGGEVANMISADELYVIRPAFRSLSEAEKERLKSTVQRPSMNARFAVFYVHLPQKETTFLFVNKSGLEGQSRACFFYESEEGVEIQLMSDITSRINEKLANDDCSSTMSAWPA